MSELAHIVGWNSGSIAKSEVWDLHTAMSSVSCRKKPCTSPPLPYCSIRGSAVRLTVDEFSGLKAPKISQAPVPQKSVSRPETQMSLLPLS